MTVARRIVLFCGALSIVSSCQQADSVVVVSVTAATGVGAVTQLRALMSNGGATSVRLYPEQPAATPLLFAAAPITFAVVVPRGRTGTFDIAVDGLSGAATPMVVASGAGRAVLNPGGRADVSVVLLAGPSTCGNGALDPGESCDDDNRFSGDGCDFRCQLEVTGAAGRGGGGAGGVGEGTGGGGSGLGGGSSGGAVGTGGNGSGGASARGGAAGGGAATGGVPGTGGAAAGGAGGSVATGGAGGQGGAADTTLQLWYRFDDATGTLAADASGRGRTGTLVSISPGSATFSTEARVGSGAVDLMGQDTAAGGYVLLPASLDALAPDAITIACWVALRTSPAEARLFDFGVDADTSMFLTPRHAALLGLGGDVIQFQIAQGAFSQQAIQSTSPLPTGGWHHVAVVLRSGSPYTGALYVDGALAGMNSSMTLHPSDLGTTLNNWLGRSTTSTSAPFLDGLLDDFRLYSRALADSEIAALYQGSTAH